MTYISISSKSTVEKLILSKQVLLKKKKKVRKTGTRSLSPCFWCSCFTRRIEPAASANLSHSVILYSFNKKLRWITVKTDAKEKKKKKTTLKTYYFFEIFSITPECWHQNMRRLTVEEVTRTSSLGWSLQCSSWWWQQHCSQHSHHPVFSSRGLAQPRWPFHTGHSPSQLWLHKDQASDTANRPWSAWWGQSGEPALFRHLLGTDASELNIMDMQQTLLSRQWVLLPHIFSATKPHLGELDPTQLKMMLHGHLQQREL